MKKILLLFIIIPTLALSQQEENKKPLTPYADIEFKDGKVIYKLAGYGTALNHTRLLPRVYDKNLLQISFGNEAAHVSGKYIAESQMAIRDYVNTELITLRSAAEQMEYLKLCALLVIWDKKLSKHAISELEKIASSHNKELQTNAELVIGLHEFYSKQ